MCVQTAMTVAIENKDQKFVGQKWWALSLLLKTARQKPKDIKKKAIF